MCVCVYVHDVVCVHKAHRYTEIKHCDNIFVAADANAAATVVVIAADAVRVKIIKCF